MEDMWRMMQAQQAQQAEIATLKEMHAASMALLMSRLPTPPQTTPTLETTSDEKSDATLQTVSDPKSDPSLLSTSTTPSTAGIHLSRHLL